MTEIRIAVVVSHPIQHFCPQYASWSKASGVNLKVFFASRHGLDAYHDQGFGKVVKWERIDLRFSHEFLPGAEARPVDGTLDCPGIDGCLGRFDPALVIAYGYGQPLQRRAISWARRHGRSVAMIADSELRAHRAWFKRLAKRLWLPRFLRSIDILLTVGDANESYYRQYGVRDERMVRCPFPIDVGLYDETLSLREQVRVRLRSTLGIPADHVVILMVGKLQASKRQADLIRFSNLIQSRRTDVTVVLAGTGPEEKVLLAEAARVGPGGVIFAGFVAPTELVNYYVASDIYAHCSEIDAHSLAISEAVYSALPVVVSNRCGSYGPTDDVRAGLNGFVYACGDLQQLSGALEMLIDDRDLRQRFGRESSGIGHLSQPLAHGKAIEQAIVSLRQRKALDVD